MSSLPTQDPYEYERQNNDNKMQGILQSVFPELKIPYDYVFDMLKYLEETGVNAAIIPQIIRGVNNLFLGTGKGQVIVHVFREPGGESHVNISTRENVDPMPTRLEEDGNNVV